MPENILRSNLSKSRKNRHKPCSSTYAWVAAAVLALIPIGAAVAQNGSAYFLPGNLVVSRSVYDNNPNNVQVGMTLPPNCTNSCVQAVVDGTYPFVWNNAPVDGSFGITSKIFLDQISTTGTLINSLEVPNSSQ